MDLELLKEIPGYKAILKSVLKAQIQLLVEQLCDQAGEESIIITASLSDGTLSHLGSNMGKGFFEGRDEIKSQFLGYCLKNQHNRDNPLPGILSQKDQTPDLYEHSPSARKKQRFQPGTAANTSQGFENQALQDYSDNMVQSFSSSSLNPNRRSMLPRKSPFRPPVNISKPSVSTPVSNNCNILVPVVDSDKSVKKVSVKVENDNESPDAVKDSVTDSVDTSKLPSIPSSVDTSHTKCQSFKTSNDDDSRDTNTSGFDQPEDYKMESNVKIEPATEDEELEITGIEMAGGATGVPADWGPDVPGELGYQSGVSGNDILNKSGNPFSTNATSSDHKSECKECGKVLSKKSSLDRHMLIHKEPELNCDACHRKFRFKSSLNNHKASHTGDAKHVCLVCDARFPTAYNLRRHKEIIHLQMKYFQCDKCGLDFSRKESFKTHVLSHQGLKPFQCHICQKSFLVKRSLVRHSCQKALAPAPTCRVCGKIFEKRKSLLQHEQIHLEPSRQCFKCGQLFKWQASLNKHLKSCNK